MTEEAIPEPTGDPLWSVHVRGIDPGRAAALLELGDGPIGMPRAPIVEHPAATRESRRRVFVGMAQMLSWVTEEPTIRPYLSGASPYIANRLARRLSVRCEAPDRTESRGDRDPRRAVRRSATHCPAPEFA
jgi:hypothetical protein